MPEARADATLRELIDALNAGDANAAIAKYQPEAAFVPEPGKPERGLVAIRKALDAFLATQPRLSVEIAQVIEAGDVALCCTRWSLTDADAEGGEPVGAGIGAVVLRRQPDGAWKIAIENPFADSE
ncbi:MAG: SgcJ/EcaC family oxidoreductase [Planctomycetaceae bacterium]|nr:SgcJ/EcaC family oxidoreductase [Planctomycetaceae bacterium]